MFEVSCLKSNKGLFLFQGLGTDEETLIELLCSRSNEELLEIKKIYQECKSKTSQAPSIRQKRCVPSMSLKEKYVRELSD